MRQTALQGSMGTAAGIWQTALQGSMGAVGTRRTALSGIMGTTVTAGKWQTTLSGSSANDIRGRKNIEDVSIGESL